MLGTVLLCACADPETSAPRAGGTTSPSIPSRLVVVCGADGSTELVNDEVQASPDGVHIRVDNRAGEFVSLNGVGLDFPEGVAEQVAGTPPGEVKVACWPGSKHTDPEPERIAIVIHDPDGYWTSSEVECPDDELISSAIFDYSTDGAGTSGEPENIAADDAKGIEPGDDIVTVGYPDAENRHVAVVRDDRTVAVFDYFSGQKGGWFLAGYSACDSAGISA